ncbi:MAG: 3-dehydroquinate synthase [Ferruginibacter sp.]|nr:3-dehydroquinate synthase [Cytophagales bacterium]
MKSLQQSFTVTFNYTVHFTENLFDPQNPTFRSVLRDDGHAGERKLFFVVDSGVHQATPALLGDIHAYAAAQPGAFQLSGEPLIVPGGEGAKNDPGLVERILEAVNTHGIDRHSYLVAIGGGAVLDMVGYAAAVAHRGVRHIRVPTTVLSQNDSGVGVKNGINAFNKKNFLGTFAPPYAVLNDFAFLRTLHERDWRAGIAEAIKVALIKDAAFYRFIKENAKALNHREMPAMQQLIHRCAQMHLQHIAGRDPFETGSSRPLDFGHWAAHKLEQLTHYSLRHGEAVAIGMALDTTYSYLSGRLPRAEWKDVMDTLRDLGFKLFVPELAQNLDTPANSVLKGLSEFREHLGGQLTIMLLDRIGHGVEVHEMDQAHLLQSIQALEKEFMSLGVDE